MKLVILTMHFPFGTGEEFLEDELFQLSKYFEEIVILSFSKVDTVQRTLPHNCKAFRIRNTRLPITILIRAMFKILSYETFRELRWARGIAYWKSIRIIEKCRGIYIYNAYEMILLEYLKNHNLLSERNIYYSYWLNMAAYSLASLKNRRKLKYTISRAHGGDCFYERGYLPYRREIMQGIDRIYVISEAGEKHLKDQHPDNPKNQVRVARLGVQIDRSHSSGNMEHDVLHICSCSNIIALKRLDRIIKALALIEDIPISWTHIGDGEMAVEIARLAEDRLSKKPNIKYTFLGYQKHQDVLNYYKEQGPDLFINCSQYEGIPVSIMEAFAAGIPAIACNVGGVSELVIDSYNGFLLSGDFTPLELADKIKSYYLIMSTNEHMKYVSNARQTICDFYDVEKNYRLLYEDIYAYYTEQ